MGRVDRSGEQAGPAPVTLAEFVARDGRTLTGFAYVLCGDRGLAEDLVQDAYLALHRRFGDVLALDSPLAYARRAVVNGYVSDRRRAATGRTVLGAVPELGWEPADRAEQDAMWRALSGLSTRQRSVLVLRYYLDYTDADIARLLGCRPATVRSLATRAFAALRRDPSLTEGRSR